ncbi:uncharacterized protein [Setaria viridis]|uniref:uncharacterized protein n=1 Tax=Setaria viridis TaxID=4556 RepID=UPI00149362E4|nr:uncharacterized protein LOC117856917 [Setaria viridis]
MGGTLEYLSGLLGGSGGHGHDKMTRRKQLQTVELKVRMDCEGCELKVRSALSSMKGSLSVSLGQPAKNSATAKGRRLRAGCGFSNLKQFSSKSIVNPWNGDSSPCSIAPDVCNLVKPRLRNRRSVAEAMQDKKWISDVVG